MSGALAGLLRDRLTLLSRNPARDDLGGAIGGWTEEGTIFAAIEPGGATTSGAGDAPGVAPRWQAIVRTPCPIEVEAEVRWSGRQLRVRRIDADPATPDRLTLRLEEDR